MNSYSNQTCEQSVGHNDSENSESSANKPAFDFTERSWKEDFTLIVEDKKLYVTKALLALMSPVFEILFQSEFKEKDQSELELPGKKFDDVHDFLRCVYPYVMTDVTAENVHKVLPLAEEYQVSCLKTKCETFLITRLEELSTDELYDMLQHATTYDMNELIEKCITKVSKGSVVDLDIAVNRSSIPMKTVCAIKDKMVRRLEKSEKKKRWLDAAYNFLFSGVKADEKGVIKACAGWSGESLEFSLVVEELKAHNNWQSMKFQLLGTDAKCSVNSYNGNTKLKLTIDENQIDCWMFSLVGRFVIKNGTAKNENFTDTFRMTFKNGSSTQVHPIYNLGTVFNVTEGYIYNGKIEAEIHMLIEKHLNQ